MVNRKRIFQIVTIVLGIWLAYNLIRHFKSEKIQSTESNDESIEYIDKDVMKNILIWTHNHTDPFWRFKSGSEIFLESRCPYNECYVTKERKYLKNVVNWDAIVFHAPEYTWIGNPWHHGTPEARGKHQIYIYACVESSANYPVLDNKWDSYFNWTMTYKIDSDVPWVYFNIMDHNDNVIGPGKDIKWLTDPEYVLPDSEKLALKSKTKAVAWVVSNCNAKSDRKRYADKLTEYLKKLNLTIEIYGKCGTLKCSLENETTCWSELREKYYFYLAFENSYSEDYTTEKFLHSMQNRMVPIVLGGSDYSRFAPPNSYINAGNYSPEDLAKLIHHLMNNHDEYYKYFNWIKYYKYILSYNSPKTSTFCELCKALHKPKADISKTWTDFRKWWNV